MYHNNYSKQIWHKFKASIVVFILLDLYKQTPGIKSVCYLKYFGCDFKDDIKDFPVQIHVKT